jgi:hypothetical protein
MRAKSYGSVSASGIVLATMGDEAAPSRTIWAANLFCKDAMGGCNQAGAAMRCQGRGN